MSTLTVEDSVRLGFRTLDSSVAVSTCFIGFPLIIIIGHLPNSSFGTINACSQVLGRYQPQKFYIDIISIELYNIVICQPVLHILTQRFDKNSYS